MDCVISFFTLLLNPFFGVWRMAVARPEKLGEGEWEENPVAVGVGISSSLCNDARDLVLVYGNGE